MDPVPIQTEDDCETTHQRREKILAAPVSHGPRSPSSARRGRVLSFDRSALGGSGGSSNNGLTSPVGGAFFDSPFEDLELRETAWGEGFGVTDAGPTVFATTEYPLRDGAKPLHPAPGTCSCSSGSSASSSSSGKYVAAGEDSDDDDDDEEEEEDPYTTPYNKKTRGDTAARPPPPVGASPATGSAFVGNLVTPTSSALSLSAIAMPGGGSAPSQPSSPGSAPSSQHPLVGPCGTGTGGLAQACLLYTSDAADEL